MKTAEKSYLDLARNIAKVYPIISNVIIIVGCLIDICSISIDIHFTFSVSVGYSVYVCGLLFVLSKVFKFCMWHRLLIWNMLLCLLPNVISEIDSELAYSLIPTYISLIISTSFAIGAIMSVFINNIIKNGNKQ